MNVYPRKPLEAERDAPPGAEPGWMVTYELLGEDAQQEWYPDAEFAEHFYPAERLDALLAAVEAMDGPLGATVMSISAVQHAFRAFREQVTA